MTDNLQVTDNLQHWRALARPPAQFLKTITAGRLKGKSDISPQWRYMAMTEHFGPCGIGWKFTIERQWTEQGANDEIFVFVNVHLFIRCNSEWSDPIPGSGGHKLLMKESQGLHNNDEAWKMATTDAIGNAMKYVGVGADIYLGSWDGSKYSTPAPTAAPSASTAQAPPAGRPSTGPTPAQLIVEEVKHQTGRVPESKRKDYTPEQWRSWFKTIWMQAARKAGVPPKPAEQTLDQYKACSVEANSMVDQWLAKHCPETELPFGDIGEAQP